jgi:glycerophosphoryl diester phosphodiesterase
MTLKEYLSSGKIIVAAHRGSSGIAPENTLAAFRLAIEEGAQMIETDIHFTSDGEIVAYHDLARFRKVIGKEPADGYSYEQISKLDIGSWKATRFSGERIPRFTEILDLIKDKIFLNLEIKTRRNDNVEDRIMQVGKLMLEYGIENQALLCSFNYGILTAIKRIMPEVHTAAIKTPFDNRLPSEIAAEIGCEAYICAVSELNHILSDDVKQNNIILGIYSVDNPKMLDDVLQYNVSAIGTNYPAIILDELKRKAKA